MPSRGIYVVGDRIVREGWRDREPRGSEVFHALADESSDVLFRDNDLIDLAWNGTAVVRRDQAAIDARIRGETIAADDAHFERERGKAVLLVLLDEINVLRVAAGLAPRTIKQAKNAYKAKLNR